MMQQLNKPASKLSLRYYQREAIDAAYEHIRNRKDNPCIVLPTGAGKTPVLSTICSDVVSRWNGRVLVLAHVKELIQQSADTITRFFPHLNVGVYSAGLGRRDADADVVVASIQSVYKRGLELAGSRPFKAVLVDEAHRIPTSGDGMYCQLLDDLHRTNPRTRVIGLTATPYRLKGGYVCGPDHFLNEVCYEAGVRELIAKGYLSQLVSKTTQAGIDDSQLQIKNGEFTSDSLDAAFDDEAVIDAAVAEIAEKTKGRESVIVFCCGVEHAKHVAEKLNTSTDGRVATITGEMRSGDRHREIQLFKNGRTRFLCNVNVLTEGFDATHIDCVVLLRSTLSPGLYYQMVGRGLRTHPGKEDCLVLDFGGNILRHGCIDAIKIKSSPAGEGEAPAKECPECNEVVPISFRVCTGCGYEFPVEDQGPRHETKAADAPIVSDQISKVRVEIDGVSYRVHEKKGHEEGDPRTMRVTYYEGLHAVCEEWICVEHRGWPRQNALEWWTRRSKMPCPSFAEEAVRLAEIGYLAEPTAIEYRQPPGDKFKKLCSYELGPPVDPADVMTYVDEWGTEKRCEDLEEVDPKDIPF